MLFFWVENTLAVNRLPLITSLCEELLPKGKPRSGCPSSVKAKPCHLLPKGKA